MDGSIIYVLLFIFFVLPSVLKVVRKAKKIQGTNKKATGLGALGATIQRAIKEMERQAQAANQAKAKQQQAGVKPGTSVQEARGKSMWAALADPHRAGADAVEQEEAEKEPPRDNMISGMALGELDPGSFDPGVFVDTDQNAHAARRKIPSPGYDDLETKERSQGELQMSGTTLQQAVIWSEILGPPVSMR